MPSDQMRVLLLGAGSLGRAFLRSLRDQEAPFSLVGVVTTHHGRILVPEGLPAGEALSHLETDGLPNLGPTELPEILEQTRPDALVECIPQNIRSGDPALAYLRLALDRGLHVVTANKAPVALGYKDLAERARGKGLHFGFEATILDGLPVFRWVRSLGDRRIASVRGVLNQTSSLVLEAVALGGSRARGLARAQARGIAEADSVLDLDGWDSAAKAALLANVWFDASLRVVDVVRAGCEDVKDAVIREAAAEGVQYRLVTTIERGSDGKVRASVDPQGLKPDDPLYAPRGSQGTIHVTLEDGLAFTLRQSSSGLDDAAHALLMDLEAARALAR